MKKMKLFALLATLLLLVSVVFTGCGGGNDDGGTTAPGTTAPGTTDPGTTDPGTTDPGTTDPGTTDPGTTDPGTTDPGTTPPAPTEFTITFSVNGTNTEVVVPAGQVPAFTGSTDKASEYPDRIAYEFAGWDKEIVAATENTTYTAQYDKVLLFNPVIKNEDFSETVVNADGEAQKIVDFTAFNFSAKIGGSMKTVGDADKYLKVFLTKNSPSDAVINLIEEGNGGLAALMGDYKKVTFSMDLKKEPGTQLPVITEFCVRTRSGAEKFKFVTIDKDGNVKLFGDKLLTTLTEEFKTIAVTIDFAAGTVDGYVDGAKIDSSEFTSPKAGETTAEYLSRMDIYIFDCWIAQSSACENKDLDVAFGIDDIKVTVDVPYEITFVVDGVETKQTVTYGKLPVFAGSTDKAPDTANRTAYTFAGWDKEIVAATGDATYTATYNESYIFVSEIVDEDFSNTAFTGEDGIGERIENYNRINLANKIGVSWKTVGDTDKYLLMTLKPGSGDPVINIVQDVKGGLAAQMGGYTKVTYSFDLAKAEGVALPTWVEFRLRGGADRRQILTFESDGIVYLLGNEELALTTLTETFKTIAVTIDFAAGTIDGYVNGEKIQSAPFTSPKADETTAVYLSRMNVYLLDSWIAPNNAAGATDDQALCIDNIKVTVHDEHEVTFIVDGVEHKQAVKNGQLPVFAGSTDKVSDNPDHIAYKFIGWDKEIVAATEAATYTAQYEKVLLFNPVIKSEDFSETVVNADGESQKIVDFTAFNFTAKIGGSMKTVGDADKYLQVLLTKNSPSDAVINLIEEGNGGLAALMGNYKKVTFSFDLKKEPGTQLPVITEFCVRTRAGSEKFKFVTIDGEGNVKLFGDKLLTTLTEEFKTIAVTIDFAAGTVDGYVDGAKIDSSEFTSPKADETTAEYLSRMDIYIFDCWIAQSSACENKDLDVAFGIDDIKVIVDTTFENEDFSETVVNADGENQKILTSNSNAFNFTAKIGGSMKTVGDTDKYLKVLLTKNTPSDAVINLIEESKGGLAAAMSNFSNKKVTISFDLKKEADTQLPVITEFCVRTRPGSEKFKFVTIDGEGNVKLFGDKLLTTLTDTFKNIAVTIDFEAGTVDGYVDGAKIDSSTFTSPKAGETTAEYLARMDIYILDCWIAQSNACENKDLDVAFGIDNIKVVLGVSAE